MLLGHNSNEIVGEWSDIRVEDDGLVAKGTLYVDNIAKAKESQFLINKGVLTGTSIGFESEDYDFISELPTMEDKTGQGIFFRDIDLNESSLTLFPANEGAMITHSKWKRDMIQERENLKARYAESRILKLSKENVEYLRKKLGL